MKANTVMSIYTVGQIYTYNTHIVYLCENTCSLLAAYAYPKQATKCLSNIDATQIDLHPCDQLAQFSESNALTPKKEFGVPFRCL